MQKLDREMRDVLGSNIGYLATSLPDGRPNVVPVGLTEPVSDSEILLVDVLFQKTRRNLEENPHVALAVTDFARMRGYQFKGTAKIETSGDFFERAAQLARTSGERRNAMMEKRIDQTEDAEMKERIRRSIEKHKQLRPKAAVIVTVDEIHSTM